MPEHPTVNRLKKPVFTGAAMGTVEGDVEINNVGWDAPQGRPQFEQPDTECAFHFRHLSVGVIRPDPDRVWKEAAGE